MTPRDRSGILRNWMLRPLWWAIFAAAMSVDLYAADARSPSGAYLMDYLPWVIFPVVLFATLWWTARAIRRIVTAESSAYAMSAIAIAPALWAKRWKLHLYALDSDGGAPVCTVPLIAGPGVVGRFRVEVKGLPRPFARVVPCLADTGEILWPSGRALRRQTRPVDVRRSLHRRPDVDRWSTWLVRASLVLAAAGLVVLSIGDLADDVVARAVHVDATVAGTEAVDGRGNALLHVIYEWQGKGYSALVKAPPPAGDRVRVSVDPRLPSRVWSVGQRTPPNTNDGNIGAALLIGGLVLFVVDATRRVSSWRARRRSW
jgi:hypothetical protein